MYWRLVDLISIFNDEHELLDFFSQLREDLQDVTEDEYNAVMGPHSDLFYDPCAEVIWMA